MSMLRKWNAARVRERAPRVRIRIRIPDGVIVDTDTDRLAITCRYGAMPGEWFNLLTTTDGLIIEAEVVYLPPL